MRRESAGLLDCRVEKVFRSFFGERNGELSMVKKSLHRRREMAGRGLLQDLRIYARSLS